MLVGVVTVEALTTLWLRSLAGTRPNWGNAPDLPLVVWGWTAVLLLARIGFRLVSSRSDGPMRDSYRAAWQDVRTDWLTPAWIATTVLLAIVTPVSMIAEAAAQPAIPVVHRFAWDIQLDALERFLHGGRPAWEWFKPLVTNVSAVHRLDRVYFDGWIVGLLVAVVLPLTAPESFVRRRFLVANALTWFVGGVLGELFFSSGGPCYFGHIVAGPNPYAALMQSIGVADHLSPLTSAALQRGMWLSYAHRIDGFGIGAAAMPSLHVASVTLWTLGAFAVRRWFGVLVAIFAAVIFVGSIVLGWHYAIDGYAGALIAMGSWWVAGRFA